jgi:hypothetical protein
MFAAFNTPAFNTPSTFNARCADLFMIHLRTNVTIAHQKSKPKHEFHVVIVVHITATMLKKNLNRSSTFFGELLTTQNVRALQTLRLVLYGTVSLVLLKSAGPLFYTTKKFTKYNGREGGTRQGISMYLLIYFVTKQGKGTVTPLQARLGPRAG